MSSHKTTTVAFRTLLVTLLAVTVIAVVMGAGRAATQSGIQDRLLADRVLPRVQIINLNDTIARVDTATGAIHLFDGDLRNPSSRSQWRLHVRGVRGSSGYLEVQQPRGVEAYGAMFLVDIVTGETWIFTRRGGRATWDEMRTFRR